MSDHRGRIGFALGLTVGLVGALLFGLALETYPSEQTQPDPTANEDQQIKPREGHWWIVRHLVYMDDSAAQWLMTLLTLAAVVLIYQTLRDTRQMIIDTRKIGEAQVRGYIVFSGVQVLHEKDQNGEITGFALRAVMRNTGQSPAIVFDSRSGVCSAPRDAKPLKFTFPPMTDFRTRMEVGGGHEAHTRYGIMPPRNVEAAIEQKHVFFIYAEAAYHDVFHQAADKTRPVHVARFAAMVEPNPSMLTPKKESSFGVEFTYKELSQFEISGGYED